MSSNLARVPQNDVAPLEFEEDMRAAALVAQVLTTGDVSGLSPSELAIYIKNRCDAMGLDVRAQPFDIVEFNRKRILYPNKSCAEQLRRLHGVTTQILSQETTPEGLRVVTIEATDRSGRSDVEVAALMVKGLGGQDLANAYMKVITKAKRRVTFSLCGLGGLPDIDEDDLRKAGLRRLHAVGQDHGLDHDAVRAVAQQHYPAIASLTELDADDLTIVADAIGSTDEFRDQDGNVINHVLDAMSRDSVAVTVDPETSEIIGTVEPHPMIQDAKDQRVANWIAALEGAATMSELSRIGAQIAMAEMPADVSDRLRTTWNQQRERIQGTPNPKPTPARTVNDIVDQAPLVPDGEPGRDRHSN